MKIRLTILLLMSVSMCGCMTHRVAVMPDSKAPAFDHSVLGVIIPHIKIENATLVEALRIMQTEWQKQIPDKKLPIVFLRYIPDDKNASEYRYRISFEARDVSIKGCLELITENTLMAYRVVRGTIVLTYVGGPTEDCCTSLLPVSETCQRFLKLSEETTTEQLTKVLKGYGIEFREGFCASWSPQINQIIITTYPAEIDKLRVFLSLIDNGYEIKQRPDAVVNTTNSTSWSEHYRYYEVSPEDDRTCPKCGKEILIWSSFRPITARKGLPRSIQVGCCEGCLQVWGWEYDTGWYKASPEILEIAEKWRQESQGDRKPKVQTK